jgi:transcriptional regulator with XRE-family HTH domain
MGMRELRLKRGMTQQQLADKVGVSQPRVAAFETGQRSAGGMSLAVAVRICDALHVKNPRKLLEDDSDSESSADSK